LIQEAATKLQQDSSSWSSPYSSRSRPGSVHSGHSSVSSHNSSASEHSAHSNRSRPSRRGRKRWSGKIPQQKPKVIREKNFYCTFCTKAFTGRYEWSRHEETVHFPRKAWVCTPDLAVQAAQTECPFCFTPHPGDEHLALHNFPHCANGAIDDRMFFRYDHLLQHIMQRHMKELPNHNALSSSGFQLWSSGFQLWCIEAMPIPPDSPVLRCGFCGARCKDWDSRVSHIASHLRANIDKSEWWLDRIDNRKTSFYDVMENVTPRYGSEAPLQQQVMILKIVQDSAFAGIVGSNFQLRATKLRIRCAGGGLAAFFLVYVQ
jgi:hypothetical protein